MNWLHYILEANIYLAVFYLLFFIFFDRETHYKLNRLYLLIACVAAYVLPIIQVGALKPPVENTASVITAIAYQGFQTQVSAAAPIFTFQDVIFYAYILGVAIMLLMLLSKFSGLLKLNKAGESKLEDKYKLITIEGSNTAFSFFNCLFIGTKVSGKDTIIRHELVHIREKHSFDIVFLELLKVISWFNPFIYLLQFSLKTVHEYIADEQTAAYENDAFAYSSFLVTNAYGVGGSSITHSFFNYNLLKKRIIMLHQKRSGNLARLKYLMALPVCAAILCASTLGFSKTYGWIDLAPAYKNDTGKYVHHIKKDSHVVRTKGYTNAKGYKIKEETIVDNGEVNQRVTITGKDGNPMIYLSKKASPTQRKMLQDKYGYKFPLVVTNITLAPPPPIGKTKIPPPPPAPPKSSLKNHKGPKPPIVIRDIRLNPVKFKRPVPLKLVPVPPKSMDNAVPAPPIIKTDTLRRPVSRIKAVQLPHLFKGSDVKELYNVTITATDMAYKSKLDPKQNAPLLIANGKIIHPPVPSNGSTVSIHAGKIIYYSAHNSKAIGKWGDKAKNGALVLAGGYQITSTAHSL